MADSSQRGVPGWFFQTEQPDPGGYYESDREAAERQPAENALRFLFAGEGDVPPLTHEVLRRVEPDPDRRPMTHAGG